MKEFQQIENMLKQGTLSQEQAKLLEDSLRESNNRKTILKRPAEPDTGENPPTRKLWAAVMGLFLILLFSLFFTTENKPLFFLLLLILLTFGCTAVVFLLFFNILVWKKEDVSRAHALIMNEVDRKKELVPQIWETVRAYAKTEADIHEKITIARTAASADPADSISNIDRKMNAIRALVESYPEIKSNQAYAQLFSELVETENRVTAMVAWHNHKVHSFNGMVESFPLSIIAAAFSFKEAAYYES